MAKIGLRLQREKQRQGKHTLRVNKRKGRPVCQQRVQTPKGSNHVLRTHTYDVASPSEMLSQAADWLEDNQYQKNGNNEQEHDPSMQTTSSEEESEEEVDLSQIKDIQKPKGDQIRSFDKEGDTIMLDSDEDQIIICPNIIDNESDQDFHSESDSEEILTMLNRSKEQSSQEIPNQMSVKSIGSRFSSSSSSSSSNSSIRCRG